MSNKYTMNAEDKWICFHCGASFSVNEYIDARNHFGPTPKSISACRVSTDMLREYRRLESIFGPYTEKFDKLYKEFIEWKNG